MNEHGDWYSSGDPLDRLLDFHRRVERRLAHLAALPAHMEAHGPGAEACATASAILQLFGELGRHHAREERVLLPFAERRISEPSGRYQFRAARRRLAADHRALEQAWARLRRPLAAIAEGMPRRLAADEIAAFRTQCARHIAAEEALLHHVRRL